MSLYESEPNAIHEFLTSLDLRAVDEQCVCIMCLHNFR